MARALDEIRDESLIRPFGRVARYRDRCFARRARKRTIASYCDRVEVG